MGKLKIDKKGNILRPDKTILGYPKKTANVYRGTARTGRIDIETGKVYNLKEEEIGEVDLAAFGDLFAWKVEKIKKDAEKKAKLDKKNAKKIGVKEVKPEAEEIKSKVKTNEPYLPGKDSYLLVSRRFARIFYAEKNNEVDNDAILANFNKEHNSKYMNWSQLCAKEDLNEKDLVKYKDNIDWYTFTRFHADKVYSDAFKTNMNKYLSVKGEF